MSAAAVGGIGAALSAAKTFFFGSALRAGLSGGFLGFLAGNRSSYAYMNPAAMMMMRGGMWY